MRGRIVYFGRTGDGLTSYLKDINSSWMQQPHSKDSSTTGAGAGSKTAPAVPLLNAVQAQQLADGSVVGLNPAEWLVDLFTQADRDDRGGDFADAYDASQLKQVGLSTPPAACRDRHVWVSIRLPKGSAGNGHDGLLLAFAAGFVPVLVWGPGCMQA